MPPPPIEAVVIGTSAGGIEALSVVLPALPATLQMPVFVVQHLPREQPSLLVDVFAPKCRIKVVDGEDKMPIEPGTLYFAPADYHMLIDAGPQIALSTDPPVHFSRPCIDVLFESAADAYGPGLLGIILTGGNEDGSAGLAAILAAGGATIVQRPDEAQVSIMVKAALKRGPVDLVLTLDEIAGVLSRLDREQPARRPGAHPK